MAALGLALPDAPLVKPAPSPGLHDGQRHRAVDIVIIKGSQRAEHHDRVAELLRGLIDHIVFTPNVAKSELVLDLYGDLVGILRISVARPIGRTRTALDISWAEETEMKQMRLITGDDGKRGNGVQSESQVVMAGAAGFEFANAGIKNRCLTAWRHPSRARA